MMLLVIGLVSTGLFSSIVRCSYGIGFCDGGHDGCAVLRFSPCMYPGEAVPNCVCRYFHLIFVEFLAAELSSSSTTPCSLGLGCLVWCLALLYNIVHTQPVSTLDHINHNWLY